MQFPDYATSLVYGSWAPALEDMRDEDFYYRDFQSLDATLTLPRGSTRNVSDLVADGLGQRPGAWE